MSSLTNAEFNEFTRNFWVTYKKKNFQEIIEKIPKFLQFECIPSNVLNYQQLCIFSIEAMRLSKTINDKLLKAICIEYKKVITCARNAINAIEYFICLEYAVDLSNFSVTVDTAMIADLTNTVINNLESITTWTTKELMLFKRFIIILVQMESLSDGMSTEFAITKKTLKSFPIKNLKAEEKKKGWPEYFLSTLEVCTLSHSESAGIELLRKVRGLAKSKNEFKKDIAIMVSQCICACTSLISTRSPQFIQYIFGILGATYDIIRDKNIPSGEYLVSKTYQKNCLEKMATHIGLNILSAVRKIFVKAMDCNNFNENMISACSNYMVAESEILQHFNCTCCPSLVWELGNTVSSITANINKINLNCGDERGKRTLEKFVSIQSLPLSVYNAVSTELIKICGKINDRALLYSSYASKIILSGNEQNHKYNMHQLHLFQKDLDDPSKFETISWILKKLPKNHFGVSFDSVKLQFMQLTVEIEYPVLTELCRQKLVKDVCEMDFYNDDRCCYVNLIKSSICYLQCMIDIQRYKSNVMYTNKFEPLNEEFVSLNNEIKVIKKLRESLDYLSTFLQSKDVWSLQNEKDDYILHTEKMLQRIGECLMNRHYKDLAITAFELLYQLAKTAKHPLRQIVAAGYLIENMNLISTISEKEIVTELQSIVMRKLRDVNTMTVDELGNFLLSFLQLTMYTLRFQHNIEHAKKYMQAINKLLNKYDDKKEKYLAPRLKYSEVMFEMIVRDSDTTITPITFIEDIFHRFTSIRCVSKQDRDTAAGITFDLISTLYAFTQPRYEFRYAKSLIWHLHATCVRNGYLFLFAKTTILTSSECLLMSGKHLEDHLMHLDVLFECKAPVVQNETPVPTVAWNKEITSFIHPANCKCFQCANKFLNLLNMEVAAVKAWAVYYNKDFPKSLQSFQQIYGHWSATNASSYAAMLMNYSNCLNSNSREEQSKVILSEALDACDDYAQAQDISLRLLLNSIKDEIQIDNTLPAYANEPRVKAAKPKTTKKKINCKQGLRDNTNTEVKPTKKSNLRN